MRITSHLLIRVSLAFLILAAGLTANAQQDPRKLDPSDVFFQAWLTIRDAEKYEGQKKYNEAWKKYRQAASYYASLSKYHKDWKPHLVIDRVKSTKASIAQIEPLAAAELMKKNGKAQGLVEGGNPAQKGPGRGNQIVPRANPRPPAPRVAATEDQRRLKRYQREITNLRKQLAAARKQDRSASDQKRLLEQIAKKDRELATLRDMLARAPLQQDLDRITREKKTRERELIITARALKQARTELDGARKDVQKHQDKAKLAEIRSEQIKKQMDEQQGQNNRIIRGLRTELKNISAILEKTRQELGAANTQMARYKQRLTESEATIKELTQERDDLRRERDTLVSVLKQSDSKGVQKLISENMRLGRELKQATDRLSLMEKNSTSTKEELLEARRDLAIAKTRIQKYQRDQSRHGIQIKTLERQLKDAEADLAAGGKKNTPANQEEVNHLKSTVKRLIDAQKRRRSAEKLLWEAYQKSGTKTAGVEKAYSDMREAKVELTTSEKQIIANRRPDGEFTTPGRVPLAHAQAHGHALQREIADNHKLVVRFFEKGRYELARGVLLDMDERFPGYFPTLCNLGVVEFNTDNYVQAVDRFSEAITMQETSSYAHYMLGLSHYHAKDYDAARNAFEQSYRLDPNNARTQFYLGTIAGVEARYKQAITHYDNCIKLDPTMADAYFNLSYVHLLKRDKPKSLEAYRKALDNGAKPSPEHEAKLAKLK